jgi:hypothetical protein
VLVTRTQVQPVKACLKRCSWTQHIGGAGDETIDDRAQALQLAPAIRARSDVGFRYSNLARRQDLQGVGAHQLALLAGFVWKLVMFPFPPRFSVCRSL